ncbi:hypothetical protein W97_07905 [Coniosporium apollinis CBS 100218]|uniref:Uncharacterized protein n=1 Tax=Coniosporium apollinis (strain CBS 100218) TaxID=1168221 RepID=R7Z3C3_CONA1|nr:uncharacterized protein W97_07905 [Coniosporium apollinis CBS 100218]EON68647.1 hypothetical protein W97_07905 [Coniosporium apollinis CBS 100218]
MFFFLVSFLLAFAAYGTLAAAVIDALMGICDLRKGVEFSCLAVCVGRLLLWAFGMAMDCPMFYDDMSIATIFTSLTVVFVVFCVLVWRYSRRPVTALVLLTTRLVTRSLSRDTAQRRDDTNGPPIDNQHRGEDGELKDLEQPKAPAKVGAEAAVKVDLIRKVTHAKDEGRVQRLILQQPGFDRPTPTRVEERSSLDFLHTVEGRWTREAMPTEKATPASDAQQDLEARPARIQAQAHGTAAVVVAAQPGPVPHAVEVQTTVTELSPQTSSPALPAYLLACPSSSRKPRSRPAADSVHGSRVCKPQQASSTRHSCERCASHTEVAAPPADPVGPPIIPLAPSPAAFALDANGGDPMELEPDADPEVMPGTPIIPLAPPPAASALDADGGDPMEWEPVVDPEAVPLIAFSRLSLGTPGPPASRGIIRASRRDGQAAAFFAALDDGTPASSMRYGYRVPAAASQVLPAPAAAPSSSSTAQLLTAQAPVLPHLPRKDAVLPRPPPQSLPQPLFQAADQLQGFQQAAVPPPAPAPAPAPAPVQLPAPASREAKRLRLRLARSRSLMPARRFAPCVARRSQPPQAPLVQLPLPPALAPDVLPAVRPVPAPVLQTQPPALLYVPPALAPAPEVPPAVPHHAPPAPAPAPQVFPAVQHQGPLAPAAAPPAQGGQPIFLRRRAPQVLRDVPRPRILVPPPQRPVPQAQPAAPPQEPLAPAAAAQGQPGQQHHGPPAPAAVPGGQPAAPHHAPPAPAAPFQAPPAAPPAAPPPPQAAPPPPAQPAQPAAPPEEGSEAWGELQQKLFRGQDWRKAKNYLALMKWADRKVHLRHWAERSTIQVNKVLKLAYETDTTIIPTEEQLEDIFRAGKMCEFLADFLNWRAREDGYVAAEKLLESMPEEVDIFIEEFLADTNTYLEALGKILPAKQFLILKFRDDTTKMTTAWKRYNPSRAGLADVTESLLLSSRNSPAGFLRTAQVVFRWLWETRPPNVRGQR